MSELINRYLTREQFDAVIYQKPRPSYFRTNFFRGGERFFESEIVEWDEITNGIGAAQWTTEDLMVEPTQRSGYKTREVTAPRMQIVRVLTSHDLRKRLPGENLYSGRSNADRAQFFIDRDFAFCLDCIDNTTEFACSQFLAQGRIDITGNGVNDYIDYNILNKKVLSGTDTWDTAGVNPFTTLAEMAHVLRHSGYLPTDIITDVETANILVANENNEKWLDITRYDMGRIDPREVTPEYDTAQFIGQLKHPGIGIVNIYSYDGVYTDVTTGTETPYLDRGRVIMLTNEARQNIMGYGAVTYVENKDFTTIKARYAPIMRWSEDNDSYKLVVTSRPLPIPSRIDCWASYKVLPEA